MPVGARGWSREVIHRRITCGERQRPHAGAFAGIRALPGRGSHADRPAVVVDLGQQVAGQKRERTFHGDAACARADHKAQFDLPVGGNRRFGQAHLVAHALRQGLRCAALGFNAGLLQLLPHRRFPQDLVECLVDFGHHRRRHLRWTEQAIPQADVKAFEAWRLAQRRDLRCRARARGRGQSQWHHLAAVDLDRGFGSGTVQRDYAQLPDWHHHDEAPKVPRYLL